MSDLGFLEKLLDGAKVEWKSLVDIAQIKHGKDWKGLGDGDVPVYGSGGIMGYVDAFVYNEPTVLIPRKGSITNVFYVDTPFWNVDTIFYTDINKKRVSPRYLYHFIKTIDLMALDTGSGRPSLTQAILNKIMVPIPCPEDTEKSLAIQGEIVRILDSFTELTAELTAELEARKRQYSHYRDQLLNFEEEDVRWAKFVDVAEFRRGIAITKKETTEGNVPVVANGPVPSYSHSEHNREGETVVVARSGAYAGYVSYWNMPIFLTDAFSVHPYPEAMIPKFVYYVLQNKQAELHALKKGAGVPHVRVKEMEQYDVPVPNLETQRRIVAILDKFDTLTTSLSEGLPREIALRQKQYEYYRDLLLSFPKAAEPAEA